MAVIAVTARWDPPEWALLERQLFATLNRAALEFAQRYTRPDGTLVWRNDWPGMDGSDDPYEGFQAFPLLYMLGGSEEVLRVARVVWDGITWQWTEYGQIYREFDGYYDWMHHGESSVCFYLFGLADPSVLKDRQRALRFAEMYTGDDPEAPNYDREKRLIRSPITGSRGPRFQMTAEDWSTHREILDNYPPPFEDIPGVPGPLCRWTDDTIFAQVLERMNARMATGDVPLNLTATTMMTHAYLYSGEERFRQWVLEYLDAWKQRTARNGGITPDNIGLSGEIGEHMDGKWWGGYYGWRWPHGSFSILEPLTIAGANALLLDGDATHLNLVRSQLDGLWERGREINGVWHVPNKHLDAGWTDYRRADAQWPIQCWSISQADEDLTRVERLREHVVWRGASTEVGMGQIGNIGAWFNYIRGRDPEYPVQILRANYELIVRQLARVRSEQGDPASWDVHYWQRITPVICDGLAQLTLGAPMHVYRGGLQHAPVRYFDGAARRPGLPEGVAALVEAVEPHSITLMLGSLDNERTREVVIQAGTFGEHRFTSAVVLTQQNQQLEQVAVDSARLHITLSPGAGVRLRIGMIRHVNRPSYNTPWSSREDWPPLLEHRHGNV